MLTTRLKVFAIKRGMAGIILESGNCTATPAEYDFSLQTALR